jgi:hypothetical protein
MPPRSESKRRKLQAYLAEVKPSIIDERVWEELQSRLTPVSAGYLRELLLATGVPLSPLIEGVRQDSLDQTQRTLLALSDVYKAATPQRRRIIRSAVIESKDRIRWALKRSGTDEEKRAPKEEMLLWVLTWLENPEIFPVWLGLRRRTGSHAAST